MIRISYLPPYGLRNPYRSLKSETSQDYAQKPQRNCTFMNSASGSSRKRDKCLYFSTCIVMQTLYMETSSLRNLNEIVRSWIRLQGISWKRGVRLYFSTCFLVDCSVDVCELEREECPNLIFHRFQFPPGKLYICSQKTCIYIFIYGAIPISS